MKVFGFGKKKFSSDTEIGPWFRFPIPKPNFGPTLVSRTLKTMRGEITTSPMNVVRFYL